MKAVVAVPVTLVLTLAALFASLPPPAAAQTAAAGERVAFKGTSRGVVTATGFLQPFATTSVVGGDDLHPQTVGESVTGPDWTPRVSPRDPGGRPVHSHWPPGRISKE